MHLSVKENYITMRFKYIGFLLFLLISCDNSTEQVKSTIVNEKEPESSADTNTNRDEKALFLVVA